MTEKQRNYIATNFVIAAGCVESASSFAFVAHYEKALAQDVFIAQVFVYRQESGFADAGRFKWQAVGLLVDTDECGIVTLGRDGQVGTWTPNGVLETKIECSGRSIGPLKGIRRVGEAVLAYGMRRQVFRLVAEGRWIPWDQGLELPAATETVGVRDRIRSQIGQVSGIHALAGESANELFAVGERGEIWRSDGERWSRIESPTNLTLTDVVAAGDGVFYACGQGGVVLRGSRDGWEAIEYRGPELLDFRSAAWFRGRLFLADGHSLRVLAAEELVVVSTSDGEMIASHQLHTAAGLLLSVAGKEVVWSADGEAWAQLV